jgi:hypothetical protein
VKERRERNKSSNIHAAIARPVGMPRTQFLKLRHIDSGKAAERFAALAGRLSHRTKLAESMSPTKAVTGNRARDLNETAKRLELSFSVRLCSHHRR